MSKYVGKIITNQVPAGYSVFFDGSGDYLSLTQSAFAVGTSNFTLEAWVYLTAAPGTEAGVISSFNTGSGQGFYLAVNSSRQPFFAVGNGAVSNPTVTGTAISLNTWVHLAGVRSSGTLTLYVNGTSVGTPTSATASIDRTLLGIGLAYPNSPQGYITGYISNARVTSSALYTAAFTPPTQLLNVTNTSLLTCNSPAIVDQSSNAFAITTNGNAAVSTFTPFTAYVPYNPALGASTPGVWTLDEAMQAAATRQWNMYDPSFQNTTLLLHGNGTNGAQNNTFLDSSSNNFTITRNGNTTQGSFSPFSQTGWSNYFDGTGDALTTNTTNSGWQLGTGDFEIAFWIYPESVTGNRDIFTQRNASGTPQIFLVNNVLRYNNALIAGILDATITIALNKWQYCVLSRVSGTTRWFIDGVAAGSVADTNNWSSTNSWWVSSTAQSFQGYISNLRLVKGAGVTSSTVPTAPLTAISGTTFLSCQSNRFVDSSSNAFALTVAGNTSVQPFSPFYPTAAYTPQTIGGSGYFDGTGDYLSLADNAAFDFGSGDFTIEAWVYANSLGSFNGIVSQWPNNGGSTNNSFVLESVGSNMEFYWSSGSTLYGPATLGTISTGTWTHYAICRSGNTLYPFKNGVLGTTVSITQTLNNATANVTVGGEVAGGGYWNGYISNVRVIKGTAVYTTGFTPPTSPVTAITNTSLLCNFTNAGIIDSTAKNVLETVGNAQISTTQSKFGGSSIYMAAATADTDYLVQPANQNAAFGTGNFTIEFWMWPTSTTTNWGSSNLATILDTDAAAGISTTDWWVIHQANATLVFSTNNAIILTSSSALTASTWQHVALVRNGSGTNNLTFYVNGTSVGSATYTAAVGGNRKLFIGTQFANSRWYKGYIDDLRITRGIARYTANFTPQTSQWQDQ